MLTKVVVFSQWPQLLIGSPKRFDVEFETSAQEIVTNTFGSSEISDGSQRYAVRIHDRNLYPNHEYCLLINQPVSLDLENLIQSTDSIHSTYIGLGQEFVLYKRMPTWQAKHMVAPILPASHCSPMQQSTQEHCPQPVGIIFIDCWQSINDHSEWLQLPYDFDFYHSMTQCLAKYHAKNLVFHTGEFGSHHLAHKLKSWHSQGNAVDILNFQVWQNHYRARELYNWIVVGAHWQRCTHEKPLGFYNLLDEMRLESRLRIFSHMDCTVKFQNNDLDHPKVATCCELDYKSDVLTWNMNGRLPELVLH